MAASILVLTLPIAQVPNIAGFSGDMSRILEFVGCQLAGAMLAVVLWVGSRRLPKGALQRWMVRMPVWWSAAACIVFVGLVAVQLIPRG